MGRKGRNLWSVASVAAIAAGAAWFTYAVWRSPDRTNLATFGQYAVAVAVMAGGLISRIWQGRAERRDPVDQVPGLDQLADLLAVAVRDQWTQVASQEGLLEHEPIPVQYQKPPKSVTGPLSAAVNSRRFPPLPGLTAVSQEQLQSGQIADLHALYGGLGSGRLVIAGEPGSGKSATAVLLVLAALRHRHKQVIADDRAQVPVPVMFPVHGWDPDTQHVHNWLAERLQQTYPLLTGKSGLRKALQLLEAGKIAVILDELYEMPEKLRSLALQALSRQAAFRLVVLTRAEDMAKAVSGGPLAGAAAVELQAVDPPTAADYLAQIQLDPTPPGWLELTERLRQNPDSAVAQALSSPLNLTLVRDMYGNGDDIQDFLRFCDSPDQQVTHEVISEHLLDHVLPAAYTRRPGDPRLRYDLPTAEHALRCLAELMKEHKERELQWWRIRTWPKSSVPRTIVTGAAFGTAVGIAGWLAAGFPFGFALGLTAAVTFGLLFWFPESSNSPEAPRTLRHVIRPRSLIHALPMGLAGGLPLGFAAGVATGLRAGLPAGLAAGLAFGLTAGLAGELHGVLSGPGTEIAGTLSPRRSWRSNRLTGLAVGAMGGVAGGLAFGLAFGLAGGVASGLAGGLAAALAVGRTAALTNGLWVGLAAGLVAGTGVGLAVGLTAGPPPGAAAGLADGLIGGLVLGLAVGLMKTSTWSATLAFLQLAARYRIPPRLIDFLDDACDRKILRTIGPVYQFRHRKLQDRLAEQEHAAGSNASTPPP